MVDDLKIKIGIDTKDKEDIDKLKRTLLGLSAKKHKVYVDVDIDKKRISRIKNIAKRELATYAMLEREKEKIRTSLLEKRSRDQRRRNLKSAFGESIPKKTQAAYARMFDDLEKRKSRIAKQSLRNTEKTNTKLREQFGVRASGEDRIKKIAAQNQKTIEKTRFATDNTMFDRLQAGFNKVFRTRKQHEEKIQSIKKRNQKIDKRHFSQMDSDDWGQHQIDQLNKRQTSQRRQTGRDSGSDGRILQMPQNPLLGRMAQFGMMASGMAATMFLMQMISAQIQALMTIMTEWEESLLSIIDSTSLASSDMDSLSYVIKDYAKTIGIADTATAEAAGAALQFGISPTQQNVSELYALQFSDNVKDYKEAAMIMNMAGSEFGDNAAVAYKKKWDTYSGEGETSGSFGYEWDRLKGAGKSALTSIGDAGYTDALTNSLRGLSDWISANKDSIGGAFDNFISGLTTAWTMLKIITPAATIFLGLFVAKSGLQMFTWLLTSMSKMLGPLSMGLMKTASATTAVGTASAAATTSALSLKATLLGLSPAIIAVGVAFAAWKMFTWFKEWYEFNNLLRESIELTDAHAASMSDAQRSSSEYAMTQQVDTLNEEILALKEKSKLLKTVEPTQKQAPLAYDWTKFGINTQDQKDSGINQQWQWFNEDDERSTQKIFEQNITKKQEQIESFILAINKLKLAKDAKLQEALSAISGTTITIPWAEQSAALEKVNKELGYMPALLGEMHKAEQQVDFSKNIESMGVGQTIVINAKKQFDDILKMNAEVNQNFELALNQESIDMGGMSATEKLRARFTAIRSMMVNELNKGFDTSNLDRMYALFTGIEEIEKVINNLSTDVATDNIKAYRAELDKLSETVDQLGMSSYGKIIDELDRKVKQEKLTTAQRDALALEQQQLLNDSLTKELDRLRGKKTDSALKIKDIESSSIKEEDKRTLIDVTKLTDQITSKEAALSREKAIGLGYTTATETELIMIIANLKKMKSFALGFISEDDLVKAKAYNKELKLYTDRITNASRGIESGKRESSLIGTISDQEKITTIKKRILEIDRQIDQGTSTRNEIETIMLKNQHAALITTEEEIRQLSSLTSQTDQYNKSAYTRMTLEEKAMKFKLIDTKAALSKQQGMPVEEANRAATIEKADIDQAYFKDDRTAWEQHYSLSGEMSTQHYNDELKKIGLAYLKRSKTTEIENNKALRREEEYQLKLKNRRKLSFGEDLSVGATEALRKISDQYMTAGQIMETSLVSAFDNISRATSDWIMGMNTSSESFKAMAKSILADMVAMIIKQELLNATQSLFGDGSSSSSSSGSSSTTGSLIGAAGSIIGSLFASKQGNIVSGIGSYSNQVVSKPTIVPNTTLHKYATGGALFGEAGPEAIMPLTRMPSGNLGVETSNNAVPNIEIVINNNGQDVDAQQDEQPKWDGEKWVIGVVLSSLANNKGGFRNNMKGMLSA